MLKGRSSLPNWSCMINQEELERQKAIEEAKRLKEENAIEASGNQTPLFIDEAIKVNKALKRYRPKKLMELQGISQELAELNWQRNQEWNSQESSKYYRAVRLFNGDAYLGLDAESLSTDTINYAQDHLRILSGLYGWLRPLDAIEPYRLEMGTKLKIGRRNDLYAFWSDKITKQVNQEFDGVPILNLASNEYSKVNYAC